MLNVLGFGFASAVLLVTFGKLITDSWFSYLMVAIIQFELLMFWLGLRRPLGAENDDQIFVDADAEFCRNDASVDRRTKQTKDHSKWPEMGFDLKWVPQWIAATCDFFVKIWDGDTCIAFKRYIFIYLRNFNNENLTGVRRQLLDPMEKLSI